MEPERDARPAARKGPGGRTSTARSATTRKAPVAVAPAPDKPTLAISEQAVVKATPPAAKAVRAPRKKTPAHPAPTGSALSVRDLTKRFGGIAAVDSVDLEVEAGSFYGFVGPNGAGKTTTLAMITGLLRPDSGVVMVHGVDVWRNSAVAKKTLGVLPDNLRLV